MREDQLCLKPLIILKFSATLLLFENLKKILDSKVLWSTELNKNDPTDGVYLLQLVVKHIKKFHPSFENFPELYAFSKAEILNGKIYSASFCELDNDILPLTQWTYYGGNGYGICLKFKFEIDNNEYLILNNRNNRIAPVINKEKEFCPLGQSDWDNIVLAQVRYTEAHELMKLEDRIIKKALIDSIINPIVENKDFGTAVIKLNLIRAIIKSHELGHEKEWRIVNNYQLENSDIRKIPYCSNCGDRFEIPIGDFLKLDSIVLGSRFFEKYPPGALKEIQDKMKTIDPAIKIDFDPIMPFYISKQKFEDIKKGLDEIDSDLAVRFEAKMEY